MVRLRPRFFKAALAAAFTVAFSATIHQGESQADSAPVEVMTEDQMQATDRAVREVGEADPLFAGVAVYASPSRVDIYRSSESFSEPPANLSTAYESVNPKDSTMSYKKAVLSKTQVDEIDALLDAHLSEFDKSGVIVTLAGQLQGEVGFDSPYYITFAKTGREPNEAQRSIFSAFPEGSVVFQAGGYVPLSRNADTNPFYGASGIHGTLGGTGNNMVAQCSSNFAGYNPDQQRYYLITAWHCMNPTDKRFFASWSNSGGATIGQVTSYTATTDSAFISLTEYNNSASPIIFDGALTAPSQIKGVTGITAPRAQLPVCTSGATSGVICSGVFVTTIRVRTQNAYTGEIPAELSGAWSVRNSGSGNLVAQGDSGGVIFTNVDNNTHASATGLMSGGIINSEVACPSNFIRPFPAGTQPICYSRMVAIDITAILAGRTLDLFGFTS